MDARRIAALLLAFVIPVFSQTDTSPEVTSRDTSVTFNSKVSLVTVPVVVRDAKGRAIGTLKKEDFQLFDKGKLRTISKFTIEKADGSVVPLEVTAADPTVEKAAEKAPASAAPASRFVAYLFDDMHTGIADLMAVREAAIKYLNESFQPGDRAAIYTTSGQHMLEFTDDKDVLKEMINHLSPQSRVVRGARPCPDISEYMADVILNQRGNRDFTQSEQNPMYVALVEWLVCNRKIPEPPPGYSGPIPITPDAVSAVTGDAIEVLSRADDDSQTSLSMLDHVVMRMSAMPGQRSVVLASPGFLLMTHQDVQSKIIDRAIRASVTINTLDVRGLYTLTPYGDASTTAYNMITANYNEVFQKPAAVAQSGVLAELADATGGTYFHNNNDLLAGFRQLGAAPEYRYVLGFSLQIVKNDGKFHALKVTVKEMKGVTVTARHGYFAPKQSNDPATDAKEEISAAVFSRDEISDIPVEMHTEFFKSSSKSADLTVLAHVDLKSLHFKKADGRSKNTLSSVSAVFDRNGILVGAVQKEINLQLKDETFAARIANGIVVKTDFDVPPGSYVVRVVVRDSEGQNIAARSSAVEIP